MRPKICDKTNMLMLECFPNNRFKFVNDIVCVYGIRNNGGAFKDPTPTTFTSSSKNEPDRLKVNLKKLDGSRHCITRARLSLMLTDPKDDIFTLGSKIHACHLNGDNSDDRRCNLAWGNPEQNKIDELIHNALTNPKEISKRVYLLAKAFIIQKFQ